MSLYSWNPLSHWISHSEELRVKWKLLSICQREYLQRLIVTPAREFDKACANINKRNILLNWYRKPRQANFVSNYIHLNLQMIIIECDTRGIYDISVKWAWNCLRWKMYNSKGKIKILSMLSKYSNEYFPC